MRLGRAAMVFVVMAAGLVFGWSTPAAADRWNWFWTPNKISPLLELVDGCQVRIWYGNFGNVPFAKFRRYSGSCNPGVHVRYTNDSVNFHDAAAPGWTSTGSDGCGSFSEKQATGPANNIGVIEVLDWGGVQDWFFPKDNDYLLKVDDYVVRRC